MNKEGPCEQPERSSSLEQADLPALPQVKEEQEGWTKQDGEQLEELQETDVTRLTFSPVTLKWKAEDHENSQHIRDCGHPKPAQNPGALLQPDTDGTKDSKNDCNSKSPSLGSCKRGRKLLGISNQNTRSNTEVAFSCSQAHLTEHMELHTGGKECGKSAHQLKQHPRVGHQSSELHQHKKRRRKRANHLKTGGRSKSTQKMNPASHDKKADPESDTDDSCDWNETNGPQASSAKSQALFDMDCNPGKISVSSFSCKGDQGEQNGSPKPLKPFSCPVCSRRYSSRECLRTHMRLHSEGKYVSCSVCMKRFPRRTGLENHMKVHTGEKPFKCRICTKAFIHRCGLTKHMREHKGARPFPCMLCEKSYAVKRTLVTHMRKHAGEKPKVAKFEGQVLHMGPG